MKESLKSFEILRRSGKIKLGSKGEKTIVLGGLRKKNLAPYQILR